MRLLARYRIVVHWRNMRALELIAVRCDEDAQQVLDDIYPDNPRHCGVDPHIVCDGIVSRG